MTNKEYMKKHKLEDPFCLGKSIFTNEIINDAFIEREFHKKASFEFVKGDVTKIKNYDIAKTYNFEGWVCHHINGEFRNRNYLIKNNLYYDRPPEEFELLPEIITISKETGIDTHSTRHKIMRNKNKRA